MLVLAHFQPTAQAHVWPGCDFPPLCLRSSTTFTAPSWLLSCAPTRLSIQALRAERVWITLRFSCFWRWRISPFCSRIQSRALDHSRLPCLVPVSRLRVSRSHWHDSLIDTHSRARARPRPVCAHVRALSVNFGFFKLRIQVLKKNVCIWVWNEKQCYNFLPSWL